ncbi:MAG: hypothetical protein AAFY88_13910 [Acidobacteriota bacterium]
MVDVTDWLDRLNSGDPAALEDALVVGDTLYLSAYRQDVGMELFTLDLSPFPATLFADGFESGDLASWSAVVT